MAVFKTVGAPTKARKVLASIWVTVGDEVTPTINTAEVDLLVDWVPSTPVVIEVILSWANNTWYPKSAMTVSN